MKDKYFKDYSDDDKNLSDEEIEENLILQKYEMIKRNQSKNTDYLDDYESFTGEVKQRKASEPSHEEQPPKKKKKKGCGCGTFFILIILVIAISLGGIVSVFSKTNYVGDNRFDFLSAFEKKDVYNVLLIGADKDQNGYSRSDSMILVSVDRINKELKFTSFMRDIWVRIPEYGEAKLNAAYAYGGAPLLMETIENNFDIDIDNFVMVDFEMFEKLIDAMGGVSVEITEEEAEFINRTTHAEVTSGENLLNGDYALIYCRIRKLDSDFMRTQRQRKVMKAMFRQVVRENPFKTFKGVVDVLPLITTDISPLKMLITAFSSISLLSYSNDDMRIPVDGTFNCEMVQGQDSLVLDFEKNSEALNEFIYE